MEAANQDLGRITGIRWLRKKQTLIEEGKKTSSVVVYLEEESGSDRVRLGGRWLRAEQVLTLTPNTITVTPRTISFVPWELTCSADTVSVAQETVVLSAKTLKFSANTIIVPGQDLVIPGQMVTNDLDSIIVVPPPETVTLTITAPLPEILTPTAAIGTAKLGDWRVKFPEWEFWQVVVVLVLLACPFLIKEYLDMRRTLIVRKLELEADVTIAKLKYRAAGEGVEDDK
ncbi:hypothetical protein BDZ91DRAFT_799924 [Kalaharituber pfeilii]|nr:hypothetical protein BDZ91DRAFT_799924 [Kalaharituber pfeilii]